MRTVLKLLTCLSAMFLAGCAGQAIVEKMGSYAGQPASNLIAKLGYPTAEQTVAGRKAYIWTTNRFVEGTSYGCKIRVVLDEREFITSWDYEGNEGGCYSYASALTR